MPISAANLLDNAATAQDILVVFGKEDFLHAKSELVGSVTAKALEHYPRVREHFEMPEEGKKGEGKVIEQTAVAEKEDAPRVDRERKGKILMVDRGAGIEVEDVERQLASYLENG